MNSLDVIHSQNEAATIAANTNTVTTALAAGHSVIVYLDELGTQDYSRAPTVFPSQHALDRYVYGKVPSALHSRLQIRRGANLTTPAATTPLQPTGHAPNASPIQNHSIAPDVYPYIIGYLSPVTNRWYIQDPQGNRLPELYDTHEQAEAAIRAIERTN